jgi:hypothetical protein
LDALIGKVVARPARVSEADLAEPEASGCTEDEGDARPVRLVGGRPGADGGLRVPGERVRVLRRRAHRDRKTGHQDGPRVAAVLADLESAPVAEPLRATLRMLGKLTREGKVGAEDMREALDAGVSPQQVRDALAVCVAFNTTDRLADAFGFGLLSPEGFEAGAKYLLKRGYR